MATSIRQLDLFENVIPPDTPLGNHQCCLVPDATKATKVSDSALPAQPEAVLPPPPANPLDHYKRFGVTADEHVAALEWLSDNDGTFASLEDRQCDLDEIGDTVGAAVIQEQLDRIVADYLESIRCCEPKAPLLDAPLRASAGTTKATEATEAPSVPSGQRLTWSGIAKGLAPWRQFRKGLSSERAQLENHLREKGWPYVAVDEAKKAIFSQNGSNIASFDFLVYSTTGPNLLVLVVTRRPTPAQVQQMTEWEKVFGKDFLAAFAFQAGGEWHTLSLKDLESSNPLALAQSLDECLTDPKERSKP